MKPNKVSTPHCGRLPIRSIVLGPSGSGKTVLLTNLILETSRIYIFSPSIDVDATWRPVKNYIKEHDMCGAEEKCFSTTMIQKTWKNY